MKALRPDEDHSPLHSVYVDQWDWEKHILPEQRRIDYLKANVELIFQALKLTEKDICDHNPEISSILPEKIHFIHSEELLKLYPDSSAKLREALITEEYGAVFIIGIGAKLGNGEHHDGRATDYDDWSTVNEERYLGLNGDMILWYPVLQTALDISSMGIRVDRESLMKQLEIKGCHERKNLMFHKLLLNDELPSCMGGGAGQSRVCMFFLWKRHIGEVHSGLWPESVRKEAEVTGIRLL